MRRTFSACFAGLLACLPLGAVASDADIHSDSSAFVEANILGIFYHELAHALIDLEQVPIFGQEEDAADVFSILMIHTLFEEEVAQQLAYDAAWGFIGEAEMREGGAEDIAWWDTHGPDEQRFYNTVCLFYGANPEARGEFAREFDLPEERAEFCPFEFEQANNSWGAVLDEMIDRGAGNSIRFMGATDSLAAQLLAEEVQAMNAQLSLSQTLVVREESCGEANAYYDPDAREVVFCSEFEDHLRQMEQLL